MAEGRMTRPMSWGRLDAEDGPWIIGGCLLVAAVLVSFALLLGLAALDVWSGIIVALILLTMSVPLLRWVARAEQDPWLFRVLYAALATKLMMSMVRLFVVFVIYKRNGDSPMYHKVGSEFARRFRDGIPLHPLPIISAFPKETHWIGDITGVFYVVTSPSAYGGFLFFSFLCFCGQLLFLRGARVAVPELDHRRLTLLVMFMPSLLFWPSSIGKEAVMIFCLGFVAYGGGLLLAPKPRIRGAWFFGLGIVSLSFVRPHIALMSVAALLCAIAVAVLVGSGRGTSEKSGLRARAVRAVGLAALLVVALTASTRFTERFSTGGEGKGEALQQTLEATSRGGSEFAPVIATGPHMIVPAIASVLLRPFPWEARSVNSLIAASEGTLLLLLLMSSWRRFASFPRLVRRRPFLVFTTVFVVVFGVSFSFVANFGILARQRTQMAPAVLVLLALPVAERRQLSKKASRRAADAQREADEATVDLIGRPGEGQLVGVGSERGSSDRSW